MSVFSVATDEPATNRCLLCFVCKCFVGWPQDLQRRLVHAEEELTRARHSLQVRNQVQLRMHLGPFGECLEQYILYRVEGLKCILSLREGRCCWVPGTIVLLLVNWTWPGLLTQRGQKRILWFVAFWGFVELQKDESTVRVAR